MSKSHHADLHTAADPMHIEHAWHVSVKETYLLQRENYIWVKETNMWTPHTADGPVHIKRA